MLRFTTFILPHLHFKRLFRLHFVWLHARASKWRQSNIAILLAGGSSSLGRLMTRSLRAMKRRITMCSGLLLPPHKSKKLLWICRAFFVWKFPPSSLFDDVWFQLVLLLQLRWWKNDLFGEVCMWNFVKNVEIYLLGRILVQMTRRNNKVRS